MPNATLNRYALPVPEGVDGESIHLYNGCINKHPQTTELEYLESSRRSIGDECAGPNDDGLCPYSDDDDE